MAPSLPGSLLAQWSARAPSTRLAEVRHGLAVCRLAYRSPSSRTSTAERWIAGLATGGLSELMYRSGDADFFSPDLRLDARFGDGASEFAEAQDLRSVATVGVGVEHLTRGATVRLALVDRDLVSADDILLHRALVWDGERRIAVSSRGASVSCTLVEWRTLLPTASQHLSAAERATAGVRARAATASSRIADARTVEALIDPRFEASVASAERALSRAKAYFAINPTWREYSTASEAFDAAALPVYRARLERARRGFGEQGATSEREPFVSASCDRGQARVSFALGRDRPPPRMTAIDATGAALPLAVRVETWRIGRRRGQRFVVGRADVAARRAPCVKPAAVVMFGARGASLRWVGDGPDDAP